MCCGPWPEKTKTRGGTPRVTQRDPGKTNGRSAALTAAVLPGAPSEDIRERRQFVGNFGGEPDQLRCNSLGAARRQARCRGQHRLPFEQRSGCAHLRSSNGRGGRLESESACCLSSSPHLRQLPRVRKRWSTSVSENVGTATARRRAWRRPQVTRAADLEIADSYSRRDEGRERGAVKRYAWGQEGNGEHDDDGFGEDRIGDEAGPARRRRRRCVRSCTRIRGRAEDRKKRVVKRRRLGRGAVGGESEVASEGGATTTMRPDSRPRSPQAGPGHRAHCGGRKQRDNPPSPRDLSEYQRRPMENRLDLIVLCEEVVATAAVRIPIHAWVCVDLSEKQEDLLRDFGSKYRDCALETIGFCVGVQKEIADTSCFRGVRPVIRVAEPALERAPNEVVPDCTGAGRICAARGTVGVDDEEGARSEWRSRSVALSDPAGAPAPLVSLRPMRKGVQSNWLRVLEAEVSQQLDLSDRHVRLEGGKSRAFVETVDREFKALTALFRHPFTSEGRSKANTDYSGAADSDCNVANVKVPVLTCPPPLDPSLKYENCAWVDKYEPNFEAEGGINLPKICSLQFLAEKDGDDSANAARRNEAPTQSVGLFGIEPSLE
ncbi:hypothetical protein C8R45DRAFT_926268 [Mycena sanguinolenta]|nr:hypothetical protein C8R45DRAFT_926268 [Mycena sanguinolenta]